MKMADFLLEWQFGKVDVFCASGDETYAYRIPLMYVHVGGRAWIVKIVNNRLWNFSAGVTYIPSLVRFGVCSGSENAQYTYTIIWDEKVVIWKTKGTSQVETCLGPY